MLLLLASTVFPATFSVQAVFPFGPAHVAVAFTDSVDIASALLAANHAIAPSGGAPALGIQTVQLQDNQRTVILQTTSALPRSATVAVTVTGVTSRHGAPLASGGPVPFATSAATITGIADVHANINLCDHRHVLLAPKVLSVPGASSAHWEGTYIQTTAKLNGTPAASGASHYNYPASDQGVPFFFRVRNSMGVNPASFAGNEVVTGAGAGSNSQGTYQISDAVLTRPWNHNRRRYHDRRGTVRAIHGPSASSTGTALQGGTI